MDSIWSKSVELPHFPSLKGDVKTDVLIIGGGIAGVLCAHFLKVQGVDYILAEGRSICSGTTKNTTAKITAQHGLIYHKLLKSAGAEKAALYLQANQDSVKKYAELCREIDCDFQWKTSYVYSLDNREILENEAEALRKIGFYTEVLDTTGLPFSVAGAVAFENQAQFHPLKFLAETAKNLNIFEHTFVKELKENTAVTDEGSIAFKKAIFATHFPIDNKHGLYFLKLYQHRSYVIALKNAADLEGMYVDEARGGMSFRTYQDLLLIGGGGHRTGKKGGKWQELRDFAWKYYPQAEEVGYWAAQDCMSLDGLPYIGRYSPGMSNCFVATGFQKWGITSSMTAARLLTDMILEKENPYEEVFDPSRNMMKPQLLLNGCEAIKNLFTISSKRCPHMGCALKWNRQEQSWDCPCHGSRFDEDGEVLDNPANGNMKFCK
ncbi:MAG: FAD-dependent oxidoreductase [Lachnospiraceae bacterium]|nr:FAD-dependent oxidoreductase [Lachnospiraceae bacterium]